MSRRCRWSPGSGFMVPSLTGFRRSADLDPLFIDPLARTMRQSARPTQRAGLGGLSGARMQAGSAHLVGRTGPPAYQDGMVNERTKAGLPETARLNSAARPRRPRFAE